MNTIKTHSHRILGKYLTDTYLPHAPKRYKTAFLFGCTEPDKNPITYLKGSIRCRPLQGHNWLSAQKYMQRIALRLQNRRRLTLLDYYTMGKLIHYTQDAFTASHNESFPAGLRAHRSYEFALQEQFVAYIGQQREHFHDLSGNVMDAIRRHHRSYRKSSDQLSADCRYSVLVTSLVICMLLAKTTL